MGPRGRPEKRPPDYRRSLTQLRCLYLNFVIVLVATMSAVDSSLTHPFATNTIAAQPLVGPAPALVPRITAHRNTSLLSLQYR